MLVYSYGAGIADDLGIAPIYTRVAITKLREVHMATHPSAKLERSRSAAAALFAAEDADEDEGGPQ